ncbi:MAG: HAMP domain-containing sensor histidine kinase [Ignavibacteriales bacterium]|nr:HAMP domain-containing sensor histidine kinase [Ignavibacteriales bacterium]
MKMFGGPTSINLKILLLFLAFGIAIGTFFYTNSLVEKLQKKDKQIVELYAKGLEYLINAEDNSSNLTFVFENVIKPIDFPIILTDRKDEINLKDKTSYRNLVIDSTLSPPEQLKILKTKINEMNEINSPIVVSYKDSIIFGKIHYGDSDLIKQLRNYPYLQIFAAAMFILAGYISFSSIKKREQSNIWVGMAKETAHQLGTPISSLMGWSEILSLNYKNPDKVLDITEEIKNDLIRLNKIAQRFSKIGSNPELKETNLQEQINKTIKYFERRLPQIGKNVSLTIEGSGNVYVKLNPELFEWVLENLIKNALDAIEGKKGAITFQIFEKNRTIEIEVTDTGKGIELKRRKDVFRPGYSTKRRGWGLGLSLSKRIIEGYHKGKIFVKTSSPEGTTFKIVLKKV